MPIAENEDEGGQKGMQCYGGEGEITSHGDGFGLG
jgi:hypothetical protein